MADTNYHVNVLYDVTDRASRALEGIEKNAKRAAGGTQSLRGSLMALGGGILGGRLLAGAGKALFGFNEQMANSKIVMAGMLSLNTGAAWEKSMDRATQSVARFQEMARTSALTTQDLVDMSTRIERPLLQAGLGMRDIEDVTFGAANAAKAFGIESGMAALDIDQALRGSLSARDRFMPALLKQKGLGKKGQGISTPEWNAMAKSRPDEAVRTLVKAFNSPVIKKMAQAQSETLKGAWSTTVDTMQLALGRVGLPVFKAVTAEVQRWNRWLDANKKKVDEFGKAVADGLVTGFRAVKSAAGFVVDHADILISIAKAWAAVKIANVGAAAFGSGANMLGMLGSRVGAAPKGFKGSSISGAGAAGPVAMAAVAGWEAGRFLDEKLNLSARIADSWASRLQPEAQANLEAMRRLNAAHKKLTDAISASADRYRSSASAAQRTWGMAGISGAMAEKRAAQAADIARMKELQSGGYKGVGSFAERDALAQRMRARKDEVIRGTNTQIAAPLMTDIGIAAAMKDLTKAQRDGIDVEAATAEVMRRMIQAMQTGGPLGLLGIGSEEIKKILTANSGDPDLFKGGKNPSTTNIKIAKVEVAAKDPDRWIAELDSKVARMVRGPRAAPTRQRGR